MKRKVIFVICFFCVFSLFASEKITNSKKGTYIPVNMYEEVKNSKVYYKGIEATNIKGLYTVLCITDNGILSNEKFHDSFKINENEVDFSFKSKKGKYYLIDEKTGISYIKISDSEKYYDAYNAFLKENILEKIIVENAKIETKEMTVFVNENEYMIDKDQWHYTEGLSLIMYSKDRKTYIGLCEEDGKYYVYTLKNGDIFQKIVDSKW